MQRSVSNRQGGTGGLSTVPVRGAALVIAAAMIAGLAVWMLARLVGVEPVAGKGGAASPVGPIDVVVATLVAGLAAWAVHGLMHRNPRTARWWPFTGSTALAVSMLGPTYLADGASGVALICMHIVVGVVLIAGFTRVRSARG